MTANDKAKELKEWYDRIVDYHDLVGSQSKVYQQQQIFTEIVELYNGFIKNMARYYSTMNKNLFEDLYQSASVAFLLSFQRWDPQQSALTSWASLEMRKALTQEALFAERPSLKRWDYSALRKVRTFREKHPWATDAEVADATGISKDLLRLIDTTHTVDTSWSVNKWVLDASEDVATQVVEQMAMDAATQRIGEILGDYPELVELVQMAFVEDMQQKDIAAKLGVSRETIRRRTNKMMNLLRNDDTLKQLVAS